MHICPVCNQAGISSWVKFRSSTFMPAICEKCGARVYINSKINGLFAVATNIGLLLDCSRAYDCKICAIGSKKVKRRLRITIYETTANNGARHRITNSDYKTKNVFIDNILNSRPVPTLRCDGTNCNTSCRHSWRYYWWH